MPHGRAELLGNYNPMTDLSSYTITALNISGVFFTHFGIAYIFSKLPTKWFYSSFFVLRVFKWENQGMIWDRLFKVKKWKSKLPDGGAWFKEGFSKKKLSSRSPEYFHAFAVETNRAELSHWASLLISPIFFTFNPVAAGWIMVSYSILANVPCILAQRVNRPWFIKMSKGLIPKK